MTSSAAVVRVLCVGTAIALFAIAPARAQNTPAEVCSASDKRQACSFQCCGRRSCPPSCEVDCVKVCVDSCVSPDRFQSFLAGMRQLQIRCGNRSLR